MENTDRFYHRFWFTWLVLTLLYIGLGFSVGFKILGTPIGALGLFVPFGPMNVLIVFANLIGEGVGGENGILLIGSIAAIALFIFCLTYTDRWLRALNLWAVTRILANILVLGLLTLCVDLLLLHDWASLKIVLGTFDWMRY